MANINRKHRSLLLHEHDYSKVSISIDIFHDIIFTFHIHCLILAMKLLPSSLLSAQR